MIIIQSKVAVTFLNEKLRGTVPQSADAANFLFPDPKFGKLEDQSVHVKANTEARLPDWVWSDWGFHALIADGDIVELNRPGISSPKSRGPKPRIPGGTAPPPELAMKNQEFAAFQPISTGN